MNHRIHALCAGGISAGLLAGAFYFQHVEGLVPCDLCIAQRWTHALAILYAIMFLIIPSRITSAFGFLSAYAAVATALYHVGVEYKWWEGPPSCSGASENLTLMTGSELLSMEASVKIARCSEIAWEMAGISMAGWNAMASLAAVLIWKALLERPRSSAV